MSLRFADRDMFMRYEWGLAVGHPYAFKDAAKLNKGVIEGRKWGHLETTALDGANSGDGFIEPVPLPDIGQQQGPTALDNPGFNDVEAEYLDRPGEQDEEASDIESCGEDDEDYRSDPGCDSEDEREAAMFG